MTVRRQVLNFEGKRTDFRVGCGAFDELPRMLKGTVARPRLAVLVAGQAASELCGETVCRALIDDGFEVHGFALGDGRDPGELSTSVQLSEELGRLGVTSEDLVVGVGDADTCSLVTFCASSWCGGTPYVLVPTTFDAMVSSPTVMRGLSAGGAAHMVSVQPHATLVVCDLDLVLDRPLEERGLGLVQIVAAYLSESRKYWDRIEEVVEGLAGGGEGAYLTAVSETQTSRVNALKSTSPSARQALMYGRTTARALRACLGSDVPEYLLLSEGMRFEARLAVSAVSFSVDEVFRQDDALEDLGIGELPFSLDTDTFIEALKAERLSRANRFMLPLPKRPGFVRLTSVEDDVLREHAEAYLASRAELLEEAEEEGAGEGSTAVTELSSAEGPTAGEWASSAEELPVEPEPAAESGLAAEPGPGTEPGLGDERDLAAGAEPAADEDLATEE